MTALPSVGVRTAWARHRHRQKSDLLPSAAAGRTPAACARTAQRYVGVTMRMVKLLRQWESNSHQSAPVVLIRAVCEKMAVRFAGAPMSVANRRRRRGNCWQRLPAEARTPAVCGRTARRFAGGKSRKIWAATRVGMRPRKASSSRSMLPRGIRVRSVRIPLRCVGAVGRMLFMEDSIRHRRPGV